MLELVLKNGMLIDGSGSARTRADVGIADGQVALIGSDLHGASEIDARGHVVCPGFIDTHSHSDVKVLADPLLPMKLHQGVTLEVFGQDGISVAPVKPQERATWKQQLSGLTGDFGVVWDWSSIRDYLDRLDSARPALDIEYLVPHGAIRQYVMGADDRRPSTGEMAAMRELLQVGLDEGGCGLSTGLIYSPCCYADTMELIALGEVLAAANRPLVVHLRSESDLILEAVGEMVRVAEESGCAVHISHLKIAGRANWKHAEAMLGLVDWARAKGLRITADQYPYIAGSTLMAAILPPWAHSGGAPATLARLRDPEQRERLHAALAHPGPADWDNFWSWSGPEGILVADIASGRHPEWLGKSLAEVARDWRKDPFEAAFDLLLEEELGVAMISFSQDEATVERFMAQPWVSACSDGLLGGRPHPRAYGTYPRILGRYVRERAVLTLEAAIRKMTSQAAAAYGFQGLGLLQPGFRANVVVFDPETVQDRATFEQPEQYPVGIRDVIVGGQVVIRDGVITGARPGRVAAR